MAHVKLAFMLVMLPMLLVSAGYGAIFYDDFQAYDSKYNPNFIANYTNSSSGSTYVWDIASSVQDTIYIQSTKDTSSASIFIIPNSSRIYISGYPLSLGILYRNQTTIRVDSGANGKGFLIMGNNTNNALPSSGTRGYSAYFTTTSIAGQARVTVFMRRCSSGLGTPETCGSLLNSAQFYVDNNTITVSGLYGYFNKSVNFNVTCDAEGTYHVFFDDVERMSYNDRIYSSGSVAIYEFAMPAFYTKIDNFFASYEFIPQTPEGEMYPVSYPELLPHNYSLVDRVAGYTTDWIAVNQPFGTQFSFYTPAGYMNPTTEISCPVDLWGEANGYPEITWRADAASVNRCVIEYEYTTLNVSTLAYPFLCSMFIPNLCVFTWEDKEYSKYLTQVAIGSSWTASGAWNSGYKILDENGKLLYVSTNLKCTAPANLTFAVQYYDNNSCTSAYFTTELYNVSIGVNPYNLTECDYDAGECYNGTEYDPAPAAPYFCSLYPTDPSCLNSTSPPLILPDTGAGDAGVTDPFDPAQSGNIWVGLLSPAFIAMVVCLVFGLLGAIYGGQLIGAMGFIGAFFFMTWWGLFPLWVGLGVIALSSFVTVYMIRDIFIGGE